MGNKVKIRDEVPTNLKMSDISKDMRIMSAAKWLSRGEDPVTACKAAGFSVPRDAVAIGFSRHPLIKSLVLAYKDGVHSVIQAATPLALQRSLELMMGGHGATPAVQQRAAESILDRGGVPKVSQQIIDKRVEVHDSLGELLGGADAVALLVKKGGEKAAKRLKGEVVDNPDQD